MKRSLFLSLLLPMPVRAARIWAQASAVIVNKAQLKSFPLSAEALAKARANEAIEVHPEISGGLTATPVTEGQTAEKGTILAQVDAAQQMAEPAAARSALMESSSQPGRSEEL